MDLYIDFCGYYNFLCILFFFGFVSKLLRLLLDEEKFPKIEKKEKQHKKLGRKYKPSAGARRMPLSGPYLLVQLL